MIKLERAATEGFDRVLHETRDDFLQIARYLMRRWRTGPGSGRCF